MDIKKIEFISMAGEVARGLNASIDAEGGGEFVEKIYLDFLEVENEFISGPEEWLKERMRSAFVFVTEPPVWIEEEPSWAYHEGRPMVFISQTPLKRSRITEEFLTYDEVIYLFGLRKPTSGNGFEMKYVTITQQLGF